jgi:phosphomannomutase
MQDYKIVDIDPVIFRGYDLRGVMDTQLTEDTYYTLGRAYATYLSSRRIVESTVGRDNRRNSDIYSQAFIKGLNDGGINTFDLGYSLSPIVYFSNYELKTKGSVMITASHNSKEFNGMKLSTGYSETMVTKDIIDFRDLAASKKFSEGNGVNQEIDIFEAYKNNMLKYFNLKKKWKIVFDGINTGVGLFYPKIFEAAGCDVIRINCDLNSDFPMGSPDPTESKILERLGAEVLKHGADIGFAFDADGDRMAVVDEKGQPLWMDQILGVFAKDVLEYLPNSQIVFNVLCSKLVGEVILANGGEPLMWLTGHSFIKEKIKETGSPFGGELSGHIFFNDNFFGHDDSCYASFRLLQYLERKNLTMHEENLTLPQYIGSPEIKLGLADAIKFEFINTNIKDELLQIFPNGQVVDIDGVRVETQEEMVVIRASQNGPYITVKFESKTQDGYENLKTKIHDMFKKYEEIKWDVGTNTEALN